MYGFVYEIEDEHFILVKPFWEEELVSVFGTLEQIEEIKKAQELQAGAQEPMPIIVFYDEDTLELQEGGFHEPLAG